LILCGQIYGPGLGRHGPTKTRHGLGPGWATVFTLRAGTARPKKCLGFSGPNPFGTKHDGFGPGWPGPAQFPALIRTTINNATLYYHLPATCATSSVPCWCVRPVCLESNGRAIQLSLNVCPPNSVSVSSSERKASSTSG
jgi:hypothetical protein